MVGVVSVVCYLFNSVVIIRLICVLFCLKSCVCYCVGQFLVIVVGLGLFGV